MFPCQHAFHGDCITQEVIKAGGVGKKRKIQELQDRIGRAQGMKRERAVEELDNLVAAECVLCSEFAIRRVDEPFLGVMDEADEWAV